jgi:hypothetical protein
MKPDYIVLAVLVGTYVVVRPLADHRDIYRLSVTAA